MFPLLVLRNMHDCGGADIPLVVTDWKSEDLDRALDYWVELSKGEWSASEQRDKCNYALIFFKIHSSPIKSTRSIVPGVSTSNLASRKSIFSFVPYFQIQRRNMSLASSFSCPPPARSKHESSSRTLPSLYPQRFLNLILLAAAAQIAKTKIADSSISRHVVRWHPKARSLDKTISLEESRAATFGYAPSRSRGSSGTQQV